MQQINRSAEGIETRTREARVLVLEHKCQWCSEWFETRRADARYCPQPKPCRYKAHRAAKAQR